ncbi:hypothetical protein DW886_16680 [Enterocloster aldenensis]|nr:hypothetical protein DW886_16680 [Enterocloster aldenensis]
MKYHTKNKKEYFMFLDIFKIKKYSNKQFDSWQLDEIQKGKEAGVDTSIYAYPQIKPYEMEAARKALIMGVSPDCLSYLIKEYTDRNIETYNLEDLIKNSIYVLDIDFLTTKYLPKEAPSETHKLFKSEILYGAVFGDIAGSFYDFTLKSDERKGLNINNCIVNGSSFTDDTILTCATAITIGNNTIKKEQRRPAISDFNKNSCYPFLNNPFKSEYREKTLKFPGSGYGANFYEWAIYNSDYPYGSFGNGSAMRVSPIGVKFEKVKDVILYAIASASVTHNHPEGIKGAAVTAVIIWMARNGYSKEQIFAYMKNYYINTYGFVHFSLDELKYPMHQLKSDSTCMFAVPAAVICFYNANSYEETIDNILSFNGNSDTIGTIAGSIAAAYYGVPKMVIEKVNEYKPEGIFDEALSALKKEEP